MGFIDRQGTFRGTVVEKAVNVSRNGFPQLQMILQGNEYYDEETGEWVSWAEMAENQITAYLVLYDSKDQPTLNHKQVETVFGWDGASFSELNQLDSSNTQLQFRVVERIYQNTTNLQVEWVDKFDAQPGKSVRKLDVDELKQLDARYKKTVRPVSAQPKPVATIPVVAPPQAGIVKQVKGKSKKGPVMPTTLAVQPEPEKVSPLGECTKQEAWAAVVEHRREDVSDSQLAEEWLKAIGNLKKAEKDITAQEWFQVETAVLDEVGKIPF